MDTVADFGFPFKPAHMAFPKHRCITDGRKTCRQNRVFCIIPVLQQFCVIKVPPPLDFHFNTAFPSLAVRTERTSRTALIPGTDRRPPFIPARRTLPPNNLCAARDVLRDIQILVLCGVPFVRNPRIQELQIVDTSNWMLNSHSSPFTLSPYSRPETSLHLDFANKSNANDMTCLHRHTKDNLLGNFSEQTNGICPFVVFFVVSDCGISVKPQIFILSSTNRLFIGIITIQRLNRHSQSIHRA